jgi:hypothetical protein
MSEGRGDPNRVRRHYAAPHGGHRPAKEELTARALAVPVPYRPVPGIAVYHIGVDDYVVLIAEHDLTGPLLDLVTAVLALGDAL